MGRGPASREQGAIVSTTLVCCTVALVVTLVMLGVCVVEVAHAIRAATLQRKYDAERLREELHKGFWDVQRELASIGRQLTESAPTGSKIVR